MWYRIRIGKQVVVGAETDNEKEVEVAKKLIFETILRYLTNYA